MKTRWMKKAAALIMTVILMAGSTVAFAENVNSQRLNTYYSLAVGYINQENYEKAMTYIDKALEICTEETTPEVYADLHLKKGCVYTLQKQYDEAIAELNETVRVSPELSEAYLVFVQVYSETENVPAAAENLEKYIELSGDTSVSETLAQMYLQIENRAKAEASYRKLAESISGGDPDLVSYNLAIYEINAQMYEEALANLKNCPENPEKYPSLHYNTGLCHMLLQQYAEAAEAFTASVNSEEINKESAIYNRAVCNMTLQQFDHAIADFSEYIASREGIAPETEEQTEGQNDEGASEQPKTETETENATETEAATETESETVTETETATETETQTETAAAKAQPDIAHYYRGICYISTSRYTEAIADFTICLEYGINEAESHYNRGLSYLQTGSFENAKADFTECIDSAGAHYYRAYANVGLEDYEAGLEDLNTCIESGFDLYNSYQLRGQIYQLMGDEEKYLSDLESSLEYLTD